MTNTKLIPTGHTFTPKFDPVARAKMLHEMRLARQYGTSDFKAAWAQTLKTFRVEGREEAEAVALCAAAHGDLWRAVASISEQFEVQVAARVVAGLSRYRAIIAAGRADPALYLAYRVL